MLKKLQLKKSTSLIVSLLFLFMLTSIIVVPMFVNGKESVTNPSIMFRNDETETGEDDDDDDDDGVSDHVEDENERSVSVELSGTEAQIESEWDSGEEENEFDVTIHGEGDKLLIELEFSTEVDDVENELEFSVEFTHLIGYNDTDANNLYNSSIDETVETYAIGGFEDIEYTFQNDTNGELHILSIISTDGKFGIVVYVSNEFILINDSLLTPTEIKFDIIISEFTGDFTRVALRTDIEFEAEVEYDDETEDEEHEFADDEAEYELNINDYKGFFSWSENATTDDIVYPVYHSPIDPDDSEQVFYLNYVAGDLIIHDPKVGVANLLVGFPLGFSFGLFFPELSRSGFLIVTAVVALIAVSGSLVALRRKKKN